MKNFLRAARLVFHYPKTLAASLVCSFLVAVFWGANIGALYPVIEVTFQGRSLQQWVDHEIAQAETTSAELTAEMAALKKDLQRATGGEQQRLQREIESRQARLGSEQAALANANKLRPWIYKYVPHDPFQTVAAVLLILVGATLLKGVFIVGDQMFTARVVEKTTMELRNKFHDHVLRMDLQQVQQQGTSGLLTQFDNGISGISGGLRSLFGGFIREPLKMLSCMIGAAFISWRMLLFTAVLAPPAVILARIFAKKTRRAASGEMIGGAHLNRVAFETFHNLQTVQAYTMEPAEQARFQMSCADRMRRAMQIVFYRSLAKPITELMGLAATGIALMVGAYLVLNHETHLWGIKICDRPLSLTSLLIFYGLLFGMYDPLRRMSDVFAGLQGGFCAADWVYRLLDQQPAISEPEDRRHVTRPHRRLTIEGVQFHYTPGTPTLRDIDLTIEFGETLAIVGANGCGKSTLARLLPRFYDPVQGRVCLDGTDLREMSLRDLRSRIALVMQETGLFDGTVEANIRYGSPSATEMQVIAAAKKARAHQFITDELPDGYDTRVGESGCQVSGGQRQRIALARAILRDPELLILDEFTSQIDLHSERLICEALEQCRGMCTTIMITHRLSTLALADRIVVMESGRIVDIGTHDQLISRCGLYQRLHQAGARRAA